MSRPSDGPSPKPPPGTTPIGSGFIPKPKPKPKPKPRNDPGQRPAPKPSKEPKPSSSANPTPAAPKPNHGRSDGYQNTHKPKPKPKRASSSGGGSGGTSGLSRAQVIALQKKIGTPADGVWGPRSHAALIAWQGRNGLVADGIPGPRTLAKAGIGSGSTGSRSTSGTGGSTTASKPPKAGAPPKATTPKLSDQEMAANFGWSLAVLNSDPELKALFKEAVSKTYSQAMFIAKLQNTKWYQTHGEAWRQNEVSRKADPATYNQRLASSTAKVVQQARAYGVNLTAAQAKAMAGDLMGFGWNEEQLRQHIASYASYSSTTSPLSGEAGAAALKYKRIASDYGLNLSNAQMSSLVRGTVSGTVDESWVQKWAQDHAKSAYPALQKRIDAGETIAQIAEPFKQSYAKVLEVNPDTVNLDDRLLKQALQGKDDKGQPAVQSLWQFEDTLRNDSRWSKTQNARDGAAATAHGVLQSFGLVS